MCGRAPRLPTFSGRLNDPTLSDIMDIDWHQLVIPSMPLGEIFLRGTFVYLFLFFVLRVMRREAGALGISDLLVIVLIADAAQNAMGSQYKSITEGALLVVTIVGWDYLLDWLGYRFPYVRPLLHPSPLPLIKEGELQRRNMRAEWITEDELAGKLREQGIEHIREVKMCFLEGDGKISVLRKKQGAAR